MTIQVELCTRLAGGKSLVQGFAGSQFKGRNLGFERDRHLGRDITL